MLPLEFSGSETVKNNKITLQAAEQLAFAVRFLNGKQISTDVMAGRSDRSGGSGWLS